MTDMECALAWKARSFLVHSPVPTGQGGGEGQVDTAEESNATATLANEPAGARLTIENPAVYFVIELLLA